MTFSGDLLRMHEWKDEVAALDAEFQECDDDLSCVGQGASVSTRVAATVRYMEAGPRVQAILEPSPETKLVQLRFISRHASHRLRGICANQLWVSLCNRQLQLVALRL